MVFYPLEKSIGAALNKCRTVAELSALSYERFLEDADYIHVWAFPYVFFYWLYINRRYLHHEK